MLVCLCLNVVVFFWCCDWYESFCFVSLRVVVLCFVATCCVALSGVTCFVLCCVLRCVVACFCCVALWCVVLLCCVELLYTVL